MAKLGDARGFARRKIDALKKQPFDKLYALPESQPLEVPQKLKGLDVFVRRRRGEHGGVEITVRVERSGMAWTDGFEKLSNGKIMPLQDHIAGAKRPKRSDAKLAPRLPGALKAQVLSYLRLEYGDSPSDPDALKLSDLSYEGEHLHEGMPTHFWSYPTSTGKGYATVVFAGKDYRIQTSELGPPKPRKRQ